VEPGRALADLADRLPALLPGQLLGAGHEDHEEQADNRGGDRGGRHHLAHPIHMP